MKKFLFLALIPGLAFAQTDRPNGKLTATISVTCSAGTCDGSTPTLTTEGLQLVDSKAFRVTVCADSTKTLSGAGTLLVYYYSPTSALWGRNSRLDLTVSDSAVRCATFEDQRVSISRGRLYLKASGITVSSGNLNIYIEAVTQ